MIPNIGQMLLRESQATAQQNAKNQWRKKRLMARDFYNGNTEDYTKNYFSQNLINKIPLANVNITKRIIDRISLVYMKPPKREYSNENVPMMFNEKDLISVKKRNISELINLKNDTRGQGMISFLNLYLCAPEHLGFQTIEFASSSTNFKAFKSPKI